MENVTKYSDSFSYIKFNGNQLQNLATNSQEAKIALKELRLFKKLVNAEKRHVSNQLRSIRAHGAAVKNNISLPFGNKVMKYVRFATRLEITRNTAPLEGLKTYWNEVLLRCDIIQIDLEKI